MCNFEPDLSVPSTATNLHHAPEEPPLDTSTPLFQVGLAALSAVLGAVASNYALPGRGGSPKNHVENSTIVANGPVHVGDTKLTLASDNRVFITITQTNSIAREAAKPKAPSRDRGARGGDGGPESDGGPEPLLVIFGVFAAIMVVVRFYLGNFDQIVTVVGLVCTAGIFATLGALAWTSRRSFRLSWPLRLQLLGSSALAMAGLVSISSLTHPIFIDDRQAFDELLGTRDAPSLDLFGSTGSANILFFVAYQVLGLLLLVLALLLIALFSAQVHAAQAVALRRLMSPPKGPGWWYGRVLRALGGPRYCWKASTFVGVIALALVTGLVPTLLQRFSSS